jgi:hypothetical protein
MQSRPTIELLARIFDLSKLQFQFQRPFSILRVRKALLVLKENDKNNKISLIVKGRINAYCTSGNSSFPRLGLLCQIKMTHDHHLFRGSICNSYQAFSKTKLYLKNLNKISNYSGGGALGDT